MMWIWTEGRNDAGHEHFQNLIAKGLTFPNFLKAASRLCGQEETYPRNRGTLPLARSGEAVSCTIGKRCRSGL